MRESLTCRPLTWLFGATRRARMHRYLSHASAADLLLHAIGALPFEQLASPDEIGRVISMGDSGGAAAEEVYRLYSKRVFRFIYWRIGEQNEDAEELTLDTFMSAIRMCKTFDGRSSVFVWLCGIAKLRMIDMHRRGSRGKRRAARPLASLQNIHESDLEDTSSARTLVDQICASQLVNAALLELSEDEREAILLQHVDGLSVREVAGHLGRSQDAVDALSRRAKTKLRSALLTLMGEEAGVD